MSRHQTISVAVRLILATTMSAALFGCTSGSDKNPAREIAGYSTGEVTSSGDVVHRKPTEQEKKSVDESFRALQTIDEHYPRPAEPDLNSKLYRVVKVGTELTLQLDTGPSVRIDGLQCSSQGIDYISRVLTDGDSRIAYRPFDSGSRAAPIPSEVWLVDVAASPNGPITNDSLIAETALTSGWCVPLSSPTSPHYERYRALAALAPSGR